MGLQATLVRPCHHKTHRTEATQSRGQSGRVGATRHPGRSQRQPIRALRCVSNSAHGWRSSGYGTRDPAHGSVWMRTDLEPAPEGMSWRNESPARHSPRGPDPCSGRMTWGYPPGRDAVRKWIPCSADPPGRHSPCSGSDPAHGSVWIWTRAMVGKPQACSTERIWPKTLDTIEFPLIYPPTK